jgi:hypothetical protein
MISETKIDESFPANQFALNGYTPYRLDRSGNGGGILLYIRADIPSKLINKVTLDVSYEGFFVELNIMKKKWLLSCSYNPKKSNIKEHLDKMRIALDTYSSGYDNFLIIGDFNAETKEDHMKEFCNNYHLTNLIKKATCYKNPDNPSCIDLMLTNRSSIFQNSVVIESGLSDFHKMTVTVLKTYFQKQAPNIIQYRKYKDFSRDIFREDVERALSVLDYDTIKISDFTKSVVSTLNKHAPLKKRYVRSNQGAFMNKALHKAVMERSRLRNKYMKFRSDSNKYNYNRQRNYCVNLFRRAKRDFYNNNIDMRTITDNKLFWKTMKPLFSEKSISKKVNKITLVIGDKVISNDLEIAKTFNDYFKNLVPNLQLKIKTDYVSLHNHIKDPVLRAIRKYENYPSIIAIKNHHQNRKIFEFHPVSKDEILREIETLNKAKATHENDIPTKILKNNNDIFCEFITMSINNTLTSGIFPDELKRADIIPVHKRQ